MTIELCASRINAQLKMQLRASKFWSQKLKRSCSLHRMHLAVMSPPYFGFVMDGTKTVESRFSKVKCAPYRRVGSGDVILLKPTGKGVSGLAYVDAAFFFEIAGEDLEFIKERFGQAIRPAGDNFWDDRKEARYVSLISISNVVELKAFKVQKRDRRGWAIVD